MKTPAKMLTAAGLFCTALTTAPATANDDWSDDNGSWAYGHFATEPGPRPWLQVAHYDDDDDDYEYDDDDDDDGYHRHHHKTHKKHHRKAHKKHRKHKRKHAKRQEHYHYHEHHHYYAETPRRRHDSRYEAPEPYSPGPYYHNDRPYDYDRPPYYDRTASRGRFTESGFFGDGCNYGIIGSVIGGGLGALVGSQIGSGSGNTAAIIGGALAGIVVGNGVGGYLEESDRSCVGAALDQADDYETISWNNPQNGDHYEVTPVRSYETQGGRYCREYNTTVVVGGRTERAYGTACRQPDGAWQIQH